MNLIFLDTETTGLSPEDRVIQVAYKVRRAGSSDFADPISELFRPPLPINFEAMATHHITQAMVEERGAFVDSEMRQFFLKHLDHIVVAHNAPFDLEMLKKEGVNFPNFIDTKKLAEHLLDLPSSKLQYLRYALGLKVDGKSAAHSADGDVNVLEALFDHLFQVQGELLNTTNTETILDRLTTLSSMPVLLKRFSYGKYYGDLIEEKVKSDRQYVEWMYNSESSKADNLQNNDLVFSLKHYLGKLV